MTVPASGYFAEPLSLLADILAASAAVQARLDAADETEARARIYWGDSVTEAEPGKRPYIHLGYREWKLALVGGGSKNYFLPRGVISLEVADVSRYPGSTDELVQDDQTDFYNFLGSLLQAIDDAAAADDNLAVTGVDLAQDPVRSDRREDATKPDETTWDAEFLVSWGHGD